MGCVSSSPDVSNPTEKTNELQKTVIGEKAAKTALQQKKKTSVGWRVWAKKELQKQDQWYYAASMNSHLRGRNETKLSGMCLSREAKSDDQ